MRLFATDRFTIAPHVKYVRIRKAFLYDIISAMEKTATDISSFENLRKDGHVPSS